MLRACLNFTKIFYIKFIVVFVMLRSEAIQTK